MGPSGCGKSTLFKLLLGMYSPWQGNVALLGHRAGTIRKGERSLYGCVEQEFSAVPGTVKDQVTLGDDSVTPEQVDRAWPGGTEGNRGPDAPGEGNPHGGRTVLPGRTPAAEHCPGGGQGTPLLLLDEITANLDSQTEARVLEAWNGPPGAARCSASPTGSPG